MLQDAGRTVFPYLLWHDWPSAAERLLDRARRGEHCCVILCQLDSYRRFVNKDPEMTFPEVDGFHEELIDTSRREFPDVAIEIMRKSRV